MMLQELALVGNSTAAEMVPYMDQHLIRARRASPSLDDLMTVISEIIYFRPKEVVFLNGYVDIKIGARLPDRWIHVRTFPGVKQLRRFARTLWRRRTPPDIYAVNPEVVVRYLSNMEIASDILQSRGVATSVALQPYLPLCRKPLSRDEQRILEDEKKKPGKLETFVATYREMQAGLETLALRKSVRLIRAIQCFDDDPAWCFTDVVHLTDHGYRKLAKLLLEKVSVTVK